MDGVVGSDEEDSSCIATKCGGGQFVSYVYSGVIDSTISSEDDNHW